MADFYTPTAEYTADPQDWSTWAMQHGAGKPLARMIADRLKYARGSDWGTLVWNGHFAASGTAAAPVVVLGPIEAVTLRDGAGVWRPYFESAGKTAGAPEIEGGGPLAADTWYYVYLYADAAAPAAVKVQISTTPPSEAPTPGRLQGYKRGEVANYRYAGAFVTDAAGDPRPVLAVKGEYSYISPPAPGSWLHAGLGPGGPTTVSLATRVPPHVRRVRLRLGVVNLAAESRMEITTTGMANYFGLIVCTATYDERHVTGDTDATQQVDWRVVGAAALGGLDVAGFAE
jgi:hypothetical protein